MRNVGRFSKRNGKRFTWKKIKDLMGKNVEKLVSLKVLLYLKTKF
jgi:hypothetical protein